MEHIGSFWSLVGEVDLPYISPNSLAMWPARFQALRLAARFQSLKLSARSQALRLSARLQVLHLLMLLQPPTARFRNRCCVLLLNEEGQLCVFCGEKIIVGFIEVIYMANFFLFSRFRVRAMDC